MSDHKPTPTPLELSAADAAVADQYAAKWGCTRDEAVTRMVAEQLRHLYAQPRRAPARVLPFPKR
ncbi:hypothetical protein [Acidovorax sp. Leaf160]|uniref:hypothetical protein n=1 Tax=Acidovorax sp. Leaf160 TaxID=1736280 RepID=UPI0006F37D5C|nr:hypothetical protein [Acidovorax sp. Leaf160]KQR62639.1 hypothetical protein ASF94_15580 [Acidovorax sp. Leaf160]